MSHLRGRLCRLTSFLGDKPQTAIEIGKSRLTWKSLPLMPRIGFSCNLLKRDMEVMILSSDTLEGTQAQIEAGLNKIASVLGPLSWDPKKRGFVPGSQAAFAVVIDGETLRFALLPELKPLFLNLGTQCETVVCCRVSPAQKALTVKLVNNLTMSRPLLIVTTGQGGTKGHDPVNW